MDEYLELHAINAGYGKTGERLLPYIQPLIQDSKAQRILDFGCGKGALGKLLVELGCNVTLYDPYVPEFSNRPTGDFDLILCTDVFEHIPKSEIDAVLGSLALLSDKVVFVISLTFADAMLPNGSNAHCTIESEEWWCEKIKKYFPGTQKVQTRQVTAVSFITWAPRESTVSFLLSLHKRRRRKERAKERLQWVAKSAIAGFIGRKELSEVEKLIKGRSVAIVGNAMSLCDRRYGQEIDAHDVVIRLNRGPIMSPEISGTRTTILAATTHVSLGSFLQKGCSLFLWLTPKRRKLPLWVWKRRRMSSIFPKRLHQKLTRELGSRPSSGIMVVIAVEECHPSNVTLFGFDGFSSVSLSGSGKMHAGPHDYQSEQSYLKDLSKEFPFVIRT